MASDPRIRASDEDRNSAAVLSRSSSEARILGSLAMQYYLLSRPGAVPDGCRVTDDDLAGDDGTGRRPGGCGQHPWPGRGNSDRVLEVGRPAAIIAHHGPAVVQQPGLRAAKYQQRLDGQRHALGEHRAPARPAVVGHRRVHVHLAADAMAHVVLDAAVHT